MPLSAGDVRKDEPTRGREPSIAQQPPWSAGFAVGSLFAVMALALLGADLAGRMAAGTPFALTTAVRLLALQAVAIAAVIALTRLRTGKPLRALGLQPRPLPWRTTAVAFARMLVVIVPFSALVWVLARHVVIGDLKMFADALRSPYALVFLLAVGLGAPLSEELLFRGLLLPALATTPLRWTGAAILTSAAWTLLHWGYSAVGLFEIFAIGLYFAWLRTSTGTLWVPLLCHVIYNLSLAGVLMFAPIPF
jgi:hypothetical protein